MEISSSANEAGSSQNEMLFMRGKAMSGAPIISGTNQLPKPPIIAGITMKNTMMRPWPVTNTLKELPFEKRLQTRLLQLHAHADRERAADHAGHDREDQVHRADVLVVRRIDEPAPSGRMPVVFVMGVIAVMCR